MKITLETAGGDAIYESNTFVVAEDEIEPGAVTINSFTYNTGSSTDIQDDVEFAIDINLESYLDSADGVKIVFEHLSTAFTVPNPCELVSISKTFTCN